MLRHANNSSFKKGEPRIFIKTCDTCNTKFESRSGSRKRCPDCCKCEYCSVQLPNATDRFCGRSCAGKWAYKNSSKVRDAISLGRSIPKDFEKISAKQRGKPKHNQRGEKNHNWKGGGKRNERHTEMGRVEYINWRKSVFERDKYTCQDCGSKCKTGFSVYLHAHHIKEWKNFPELRYSIENGVTLCIPCHLKVHKILRSISSS